MSAREVGGIFALEESDVVSVRSPSEEAFLGELVQDGDLLCLSGRTALQIVIREVRDRTARDSNRAMVAYLPSYCCDAVLDPFVKAGFELKFYRVGIGSHNRLSCEVNFDERCDVFFATSYFGYSSTTMGLAMAAFKERGIVVIEDATHRLLSGAGVDSRADYTFGSLRKWIAAPSGGFARAKTGKLSTELRPPGEAASVGAEAMRLKARYISEGGPAALKADYLRLQRLQTALIGNDYTDRGIDSASRQVLRGLDVAATRAQRLRNAKRLVEGICRIPAISALIDLSEVDDCPLFVPILVSQTSRPRLLHELVRRGLYMPVHWPQPAKVPRDPATTEIYEREVSLVCDQRYDEGDMNAILDCLDRAA